MKIVLLSSGLRPEYGGSAISEASLAAALAPHSSVTMLCPTGRWASTFTGRFGLDDVRVFSPFDVVSAFVARGHWLRGLLDTADIVHVNGHWRWETYLITRLCRRAGVPYVLQPRGMLLVGHRNVALKRLFNHLIGCEIVRRAATVIALSRYETTQFEPYRISSDRIAIVPNGIPHPPVPRTATTGNLNRTPHFLYIGRLEARKNVLVLVDAYAEYRRSGGTARLVMVGPAERGYDDEVRAHVHALALTPHVSLLPPVYDDGKWSMIRAAIAVIYPTVHEAYGRVPFEAVAADVFPLVPDESGSAEYLAPFLPYCIYDHRSHFALAAAMRAVERRSDRADLARARAHLTCVLDWKQIAATVVALYEAAANGVTTGVLGSRSS